MKKLILISGVILIGIWCARSSFAQQAPDLFKPVKMFGEINPGKYSGGLPVKRYREVLVQTSLISSDAARDAIGKHSQAFGPDDAAHTSIDAKLLTLNLFDDLSLVAELTAATVSADGKTTTWSGTVRGAKGSSVSLSVSGRVTFGNVSTESGSIYEIRPVEPDKSSTQIILEVRQSDFPKEGKPIRVKTSGTVGDINPNPPPQTINILVAYTPSAASAVQGASGMAALIATAEKETNDIYLNSGVSQRIRVVTSLAVNYDETDGGYERALSRITDPKDGYMDNVQTVRESANADAVVLLIKDSSSCGLSYLSQPPSADFASKAFSVVGVACATGYFSFAHELGHLQGCNHDRPDADGPGAFEYSYGYQQTSHAPFFRDVMSYDCPTSCARVNRFSSPSVQYNGIAVGEVVGGKDLTDNALTLNRTQTVASQWRKYRLPH